MSCHFHSVQSVWASSVLPSQKTLAHFPDHLWCRCQDLRLDTCLVNLLAEPTIANYNAAPGSSARSLGMPEFREARTATLCVPSSSDQCQHAHVFKTLSQFADTFVMQACHTAAHRPPSEFAVKSGKQPRQPPIPMTLLCRFHRVQSVWASTVLPSHMSTSRITCGVCARNLRLGTTLLPLLRSSPSREPCRRVPQ